MKVVKKGQTKEYKNSETCIATEYPLENKEVNGAVISLDGRYPEGGRVVNLKCKELAYVIKGSGKVVVDGIDVLVYEGDLVLIEAGEKYYWEGNLQMFVPCVPAWSPEQHKEVK